MAIDFTKSWTTPQKPKSNIDFFGINSKQTSNINFGKPQWDWYTNKRYVQDIHKDEWTLEQWAKSLIRAPLKVLGGAIAPVEDIEQGSMNLLDKTLWEWALNPLLNVIGKKIKGDQYKDLPTWYNDVPSVNNYTENIASNPINALSESLTTDKTYDQASQDLKKQQFEAWKNQWIGGSLANIWGGAVNTAFNIMAPWVSAWFMGASELPWAQYVPQVLWSITQKPIDYLTHKAGGAEETAQQLGSIANYALPVWRWKIAEMKPTSTLWKWLQSRTLKVADAITNPLWEIAKTWKNVLWSVREWAEKMSNDLITQAVNPTKIENKKIIQQRVDQFKEYLKKTPDNSLESVKERIDSDLQTAWKKMTDYEENVWVKWSVETAPIIKKIEDNFIEKTKDGTIINDDTANIANQLIEKLKSFWDTIKDSDIIKIRRSWDGIIEKNKWFMQSAEANIKWEIFDEANKFFREEIHKSNPEYSKALQDYHRTKTLSDVIGASIDRKTGQTGGGWIRRGLENTARVTWAWLWWAPGYLLAEALNQWVKMATSPNAKLTFAKILSNGKKNEYRTSSTDSGGGDSNRNIQSERLGASTNYESIPWSKKTTLETPRNPTRNESKILGGKKWVMVEPQKETLLLWSGKKPTQTTTTKPKKGTNTPETSKNVPIEEKIGNMTKWEKKSKKTNEKKILWTKSEIKSLQDEIKTKQQLIKSLWDTTKKWTYANEEYTRQIWEIWALEDRIEYLNNKSESVGSEWKTIVKPKEVSDYISASKKALSEWKPTKWGYKVSDIDISKTNAFPSSKYHKSDYTNTASYRYWLQQAKEWKQIPPIVVEKTSNWYNIVDWYHRIAAAEDAGIKNIKAVVLDTPIIKWQEAKWLKQFTKFSDSEIEKMLSTGKWRTPSWPITISTSGKKVIKKAPESPLALERGYTLGVKKPQPKMSSDTEWKVLWTQKNNNPDSALIEEARKYESIDEFIASKQQDMFDKLSYHDAEIRNIQSDRHSIHATSEESIYNWRSNLFSEVNDIADKLDEIDILWNEGDYANKIRNALDDEMPTKIDLDFDDDYSELKNLAEEWDIDYSEVRKYEEKHMIDSIREINKQKEKVNSIIEEYLSELDRKYDELELWNWEYNDNTSFWDIYSRKQWSFSPSGFARARSILWTDSNNTAKAKQYDSKISFLKEVYEQAHSESKPTVKRSADVNSEWVLGTPKKTDIVDIEKQSLIEEAKKYKNGSEFYERASWDFRKKMREEWIIYKSQYEEFFDKNIWNGISDKRAFWHTAPKKSTETVSIDRMDELYPRDFYEKWDKAYSSWNKWIDLEVMNILRKIKQNPDADVTIYRAVPKWKWYTDISEWDWVALSKGYAKIHWESNLWGNYEILSKKVKAKDIYSDANSIQEYWYDPPKPKTRSKNK